VSICANSKTPLQKLMHGSLKCRCVMLPKSFLSIFFAFPCVRRLCVGCTRRFVPSACGCSEASLLLSCRPLFPYPPPTAHTNVWTVSHMYIPIAPLLLRRVSVLCSGVCLCRRTGRSADAAQSDSPEQPSQSSGSGKGTGHCRSSSHIHSAPAFECWRTVSANDVPAWFVL
jgi:hypothetical protein